MPGENITVYQKETVHIAEYNNNRAPQGVPDATREVVRYSKTLMERDEVTNKLIAVRTVEVTDPGEIAEIERRGRS